MEGKEMEGRMEGRKARSAATTAAQEIQSSKAGATKARLKRQDKQLPYRNLGCSKARNGARSADLLVLDKNVLGLQIAAMKTDHENHSRAQTGVRQCTGE
jgi:hypothetical protein